MLASTEIGDPSDIFSLWLKSQDFYVARIPGDGWETISEIRDKINKNHLPVGYKKVASWLDDQYNSGLLEKSYTLVNGRRQACYRTKEKATLLIKNEKGKIVKIRSKGKKKK